MNESLFDKGDRSDAEPARFNEPRFTFLNRVKSKYFGRVRDLLDAWFERLPGEVQADVRARFRSSDNAQMMGAFWELYLHESLSRAGFELEAHPTIALTSRHPDYLVTKAKQSFLLEAVVAIPGSQAERASARLVDQVYDELNKLNSPNFFIGVAVVSTGRRAPRIRKLRAELEAWLGSLDPDAVTNDLQGHNAYMDAPEFAWIDADWEVLISAIPKSARTRGESGVRPIGISGPAQPAIVNRRGPIRDALEVKATAYGDLDLPYVIAVLVDEYWASGVTIENVLYGELGSRLTPSERRKAGTEGFFFSGQAARVSAVLAATELAPWRVAKHAPDVWINPLSRRPLTVRLPWPEVTIRTQSMREEPRIQMNELFSVPSEWPGPEEPFEKELRLL